MEIIPFIIFVLVIVGCISVWMRINSKSNIPSRENLRDLIRDHHYSIQRHDIELRELRGLRAELFKEISDAKLFMYKNMK